MRFHALALAMVAAATAQSASADVVSDWAEVLTTVNEASDDPMAPYDPNRMHVFGRATLAMFEAANAVDPQYRSYLKLDRAPRDTSMDAAVATAAHEVLGAIYPDQKKTIDDALTLSLADVPEGRARTNGIALGKRAAKAALARGGVDPDLPLGYYRPTGAAGRWAPSNVPFPPEIVAGRPWFLESADQFRIADPVALTSAEWAASFSEVKRMGARESKDRSAAQTLKARFWAFYDLDPVLRQIASQPGRSVVRNARMYALFSMAADDMDIAMAEGKMHHMFWRPINAIRTADDDGNDATEREPGWVPLLNTPNQPEYPCGHCMFSNLTATILSAEGAPPPGGYAFTSARMKGMRVTVPDLATYARQVSDSRIHAGVHFRSTNDISDDLGRRLARHAMERFAPPLD
jgi:hypothetical protein